MGSKSARPKRIKKTNVPLIVGLTAAISIVGVLSVQGKSQPQAEATVRPEVVVQQADLVVLPVPSRPIAQGERLIDVPLMTVSWPGNSLVGDYVRSEDALGDAVATSPLPEGLPIPRSSITSREQLGNAVVDRIPEGMRAITVRVDAESAVEGWARPGNFVDVILLRPSKDSGIGLETKVIAENVKILSAGSSALIGPQGAAAQTPPATITLLTSQNDSLRIKTASHVGKLAFSLRGQGDDAPTISTAMNQRTLLGDAAPTPKQGAAFRGVARGPDGRIYVLDGSEQWSSTAEQDFARRIGDPNK